MDNTASYRSSPSELGLSSQYLDVVTRTDYTQPEKYLMLAVLRDAILEYRNNSVAGNRLYQNARTWFFEESSDQLFSFENICATLDLNPCTIREQLLANGQRRLDRRFRKLDARFSGDDDNAAVSGT